jgi:serine/threonine protein kinase
VLQKSKRAKEAFPLPVHLRIIANALEGLHYAHELTDYDGTPLMLVHRDISPHNVFVTFDGQVKVLDFGIAKAVGSSTHTETGVLKGKISYMSPEQMSGMDTDRRADIYATGAMLWAAAAGEKLWKNVSDVAIMRRVLNGEIPSPRTLNPELDEELERITMKALACAPADRYATALELQADLEKLLERIAPTIKQKGIGALVSDLFQENRRAVRALIERQLSQAATPDFHPVDMGEIPNSGSSQSSRTRDGTVAIAGVLSSDTSADRARRSSRVAWLALAAGVVLASVWLLRLRASDGRTADAPHAEPFSSQSVAAVSNVAKPQASIELHFAATPAEAKLFLDDELLAGNPATRVVVPDGSSHTLRAEAHGYVPQSTEVTWLTNERVALSLEHDPKAAVHHNSAQLKPATAPAHKPPGAPAVNCDDPFVLDTQGIKRLKRECL